MRVNSRNYPDPDKPSHLVPEGKYLCVVSSIHPKKTLVGEDMWNVKLVIDEGQYQGQWFYDNWIFNSSKEVLQKRQVLIMHRVGEFEKEYEGEIEPSDFIGRCCLVTVKHEKWNGRIRAKVTFNGYDVSYDVSEDPPAQATESQPPDVADEEIPF